VETTVFFASKPEKGFMLFVLLDFQVFIEYQRATQPGILIVKGEDFPGQAAAVSGTSIL
jgi:hypothetical protein